MKQLKTIVVVFDERKICYLESISYDDANINKKDSGCKGIEIIAIILAFIISILTNILI